MRLADLADFVQKQAEEDPGRDRRAEGGARRYVLFFTEDPCEHGELLVLLVRERTERDFADKEVCVLICHVVPQRPSNRSIR